jgi:predicted DsbA family dithiol-disulfide isomerase
MSIELKIFSDYIWPYCYIGKGIVDQLKKEYDIEDTWVSYELHPERPPEGIALPETPKGRSDSSRDDYLSQRGKEFGIIFGSRAFKSNSKMALEASEYSRDMGHYPAFHENMFHAYFTEALDIGSLAVISDVARKSHLDVDGMLKAIADGRYESRLAEARKEGDRIDLTGVPTFIINEKYKIVGAQPVDVFREAFNRVGR